MSIDKAEWHYGGDWPEELAEDQADVHIGFFLGWIIERNLQSALLNDHFGHLVELFKSRKITGAQLVRTTGGALVEDDLNEEAGVFASQFYDDYLAKLGDVVESGDSGYEAEDTWENFEEVKAFLDSQFEGWRKTSKYKQKLGTAVDLETVLSLMSEKSGKSAEECRTTYQQMLDIIGKTLASGQRVTLENFGTFERYSINLPEIPLESGETVPAHAGKHVGFTAAVPFKKAVDESKG